MTVEEAGPEASLGIGVKFVEQALEKMRDGDHEHAAVDLDYALIWLRGAR